MGLLFLVGCLGFIHKDAVSIFAGKTNIAEKNQTLQKTTCENIFTDTTEENVAEAYQKYQQFKSETAPATEKNVTEVYREYQQFASEATPTTEENVADAYQEYQQTFEKLKTAEDIKSAGYQLLEKQQFSTSFAAFGERQVCFLPAMDKKYHRLAIFILDENRQILYKTNELENNSIRRGQLEQPETEMAAVTFQDLNHDGLTDIGFITQYKEEQTYKIGDVLFQSKDGFYRDYRISDKMNRFGMNKNINCIASFVRDGNSIEYLYTAVTLEELMEHGFQIEEEQCYFRTFEKLGRLQVVPGTAKLVGNNIFMIYLADEQGNIVWSFQPMEDYDSLYALKGITGRDVDGDGLKDLVVLAEYSFEGASGEYLQELSCSIYYQRTDGFVKDEEFREFYSCGDEETLEELVKKIREYWGWMT